MRMDNENVEGFLVKVKANTKKIKYFQRNEKRVKRGEGECIQN